MSAWVPPLPLMFGLVCFGSSWVALLLISWQAMPFGLPLLGWLHVLTLGWLTTTALSVLIHVIPQFTDEEWRSQDAPRFALLVYLVGTTITIIGFFSSSITLARAGGATVLLAVAMFCVAAAPALAAAMRSERRIAAIARALTICLVFLVLTIVVGNILAAVIGGSSPAWLDGAAGAHGMLGILGWLSILVMGVSTRTLSPLTGVQDRRPMYHIVAASAMFVAVLIGVLGFVIESPNLTRAAFVLIFAATVVYGIEAAGTISRSVVRHRIPQAFMLAAVVCFVASAGLGILTFMDFAWFYAALFLVLLGWLGNAVLAHIHHIGVRVLLTIKRGEDDETQPGAVLRPTLSALTFVAYEIAVLLGTVGFYRQEHTLVSFAAVAGLGAFLVMTAHLAIVTAGLSRPVLSKRGPF